MPVQSIKVTWKYQVIGDVDGSNMSSVRLAIFA